MRGCVCEQQLAWACEGVCVCTCACVCACVCVVCVPVFVFEFNFMLCCVSVCLCSYIVQITDDDGSTQLGNWEDYKQVGSHVYMKKGLCIGLCVCLCVCVCVLLCVHASDGSGKEIWVYDEDDQIDTIRGVGE